MRTDKITVSKPKKRIDYPETLRSITIGETRSFEMTGRLYQGVYSARCQLRKKGFDFLFETDAEKNLMHITRIK